MALPEQVFDREKRANARNEALRTIDLKEQKVQSSYDFQASSPLEQAFRTSSIAREKADTMLANRDSFVKDTKATKGISDLAKDNTIAEYDQAVSDLQTKAEGLGNFFRTTLSQSMQSPLKDFITGATTTENYLKSFGLNVFSSIADNIIQSFNKTLADMVIKAAEQAAISAGISSIFSVAALSSGGQVKGYAFGGEIAPQIITGTQKVSGAGTGTSDSIDAIVPVGSYVLNAKASRQVKLSNGEVVIDPKEVSRIGLKKLDATNFGGNFAQGGFVGEEGTMFNKERNSLAKAKSPTPAQVTYNVTIEMQSTKDPEQDGKLAATAFIEKVSRATAAQTVSKVMAAHVKQQHKRA
jgi:hypothetical protein